MPLGDPPVAADVLLNIGKDLVYNVFDTYMISGAHDAAVLLHVYSVAILACQGKQELCG